MRTFVFFALVAVAGFLALIGVVGASAAATPTWPPSPQACVMRGSVCSSITPCCPGQGACVKVNDSGTRYGYQCR